MKIFSIVLLFSLMFSSCISLKDFFPESNSTLQSLNADSKPVYQSENQSEEKKTVNTETAESSENSVLNVSPSEVENSSIEEKPHSAHPWADFVFEHIEILPVSNPGYGNDLKNQYKY